MLLYKKITANYLNLIKLSGQRNRVPIETTIYGFLTNLLCCTSVTVIRCVDDIHSSLFIYLQFINF